MTEASGSGSIVALGPTAQLAAFAAGLRWEDLSAAVIDRAQLLVADAVANAIGGLNRDSTDSLIAALRVAGVAAGDLSVPGSDEGWSAYAAALITGAAIHTLDFDDTHAFAQIHPGAPVIAAALTAAQLIGAGTHTFLTGVIAGYEVMTRVSRALEPQEHSDRGFHLTGTTGIFGAAAAAGRVLGLDQAGIEHAFGSALSRSGGSGQHLDNGAWTKRYHVGAAAAEGLMAAILASEGFTGASEAFEGRRGFLRLYADHPRPERLTEGLGERWMILDTALKPYPCCRAIHAPLDALFALVKRVGQHDPAEIAVLRVGMPRGCWVITGDPAEKKRNPRNVVDCQFSAHLCIAAGATRGRVAFDDYESVLEDPIVRDLMQRIDVVVDAEADAEYPKVFPGRVTMQLTDGTEYTEYARVPKGEPDNPLTFEEFRVKFLGLTEETLGAANADALLTSLGRLASNFPVRDLFVGQRRPAYKS